MTLPFKPIESYEDFITLSEKFLEDPEAFSILKTTIDDALDRIKSSDEDITEMDFQLTAEAHIAMKLMTLALPFAIEYDDEAALLANVFDLISVGDGAELVLDFSFNFVDGCLAYWV